MWKKQRKALSCWKAEWEAPSEALTIVLTLLTGKERAIHSIVNHTFIVRKLKQTAEANTQGLVLINHQWSRQWLETKTLIIQILSSTTNLLSKDQVPIPQTTAKPSSRTWIPLVIIQIMITLMTSVLALRTMEWGPWIGRGWRKRQQTNTNPRDVHQMCPEDNWARRSNQNRRWIEDRSLKGTCNRVKVWIKCKILVVTTDLEI